MENMTTNKSVLSWIDEKVELVVTGNAEYIEKTLENTDL